MTVPDPTLVRSAVRRAGWRLIPLTVLLYFVNYIDRINIAFAGPNGMNDELGLSPTLFGFAAGVFFIGYVLLEVPSNLALHRFGARRWIVRILASWGIVSSAIAFVPDATTLILLRFLLGVAEAGFFPGIILYLTYWFPAQYRVRVTAWFLTAIPISIALGAITSTAIIRYTDGWFGMSGWRMMFLLEGLPAVVLAVVTWFLLTDRPEQARWMPQDERDALSAALRAEQERLASASPTSVRATLLHPRVLALCWAYFGLLYGGFALSFFLPTILAGFEQQFGVDYSTVESGLINAIPFTIGLVAMVVWARRYSGPDRRGLAVYLPTAIGGLAIPVALYMQNPFLAMVAITICACGNLAAIPTFWALPTAHLSGTAAAAGIGLITSVGTLSGLVAPFVTGLLLDLTGSNRAGLWVVGLCMVSAAAVVMWLQRGRRWMAPDRINK